MSCTKTLANPVFETISDDDLDIVVGGYTQQAPGFASLSAKFGPYGGELKTNPAGGFSLQPSINSYGLSVLGVGVGVKVDGEGNVSGSLGLGPVSIGLSHDGLSIAGQASLVKAEFGGVGLDLTAKLGVEHITPSNVYADLKYQNEHPTWYLEPNTPATAPGTGRGPELWGPDGPHPTGPLGNPIDGAAINHLINTGTSLDHAPGTIVPGFVANGAEYLPQQITGVHTGLDGQLHFDTQTVLPPLASTTGELLQSLGYTPGAPMGESAPPQGGSGPAFDMGHATDVPGTFVTDGSAGGSYSQMGGSYAGGNISDGMPAIASGHYDGGGFNDVGSAGASGAGASTAASDFVSGAGGTGFSSAPMADYSNSVVTTGGGADLGNSGGNSNVGNDFGGSSGGGDFGGGSSFA